MTYTKHNFQTGGTINAADFNAMENQIAANEADIASLRGSGGGMSAAVKSALLNIAQHCAYTDSNGSTYYNDLLNALAGVETSSGGTGTGTGTGTGGTTTPTLSSISAAYSGGIVSPGTSLNSLKPSLTVTALYSDASSQTVSDYSLSGTLTQGTSTITVTYLNKTTTFTVTVSATLPSGYTQLAYVEADGNQEIDLGITEGSVKRAVYEIMVTSSTENKGNHILSGYGTYYPFLRMNSAGTHEIGFKYSGEENVTTGNKEYDWAFNTRYTLEGFPSNAVLLNGSSVLTATPNTATDLSSHNLWLFNFHYYTSKNYKFHGRLYSCKLYDSSNALSMDLIPAKNSSNVAGLYDLVGGTFFTSATQTALIAGGAS